MAISLAVDSQQKSTIRADALSEKLCNYSSTTTEWPFSGYPPSAEFLEMNKQTRSQSKVHTEQPGANVSFQEKAIITKALMMSGQEKDAYHLLSRSEQVISETENRKQPVERTHA